MATQYHRMASSEKLLSPLKVNIDGYHKDKLQALIYKTSLSTNTLIMQAIDLLDRQIKMEEAFAKTTKIDEGTKG